ncbi:alpha/beta hydrolase [Thermoproteota archaeon]
MKNKIRILYVVVIIALVGLSGFTYWAYTPLGPSSEAIDSLLDSETVAVIEDNWIRFHPDNPQGTGLIFYQGGHVDPASYSVLAHSLAKEGYLVVIPKMPFNLAVFNKKAALKGFTEYPDIDKWVLAGHSLGGAMAASLVYGEPDVFQGLVLLAAYPPKNNDLSSVELMVTIIYASNDNLATPMEIEESLIYLPANTRKVLIEGGNHAQFGYYGKQNGDGVETITREQQHMIVIEEIFTILKKLS